MFRNLEAEQSRYGLTNQAVAEKLGVSRVTYENKKKNGNFTRPQIVLLMQLFNCSFNYLFETDQEESA
jgi:transcriptional regulator with XRE-family HTH domain